MRIITKKSMLLLVIFSLGLASCSKEKRIERQLEKREGKWEIKTLHYETYNGFYTGNEENYSNTGSFEFNDDKTMVKTLVLPNAETTIKTGVWTNSEKNITVIWSDGKSSVLSIKEGPEKGKLTLYESYETSSFSSGGGYVPTIGILIQHRLTYYLEKAD
jgi:hypothetical protein